MDKPISVGDLVVVARPQPCCGSVINMGVFFRVTSLDAGQIGFCGKCGAALSGATADGKPDGWPSLLSRLKRIPPLEELEGERTQEDIREPA
jgi:hypothetical protein